MISQIMLDMIEYFQNDARRINHALKVYGYAVAISSYEQLSDNEKYIIELSSILHDIGIKVSEQKYNSSAGKYQEIEGPEIASQIMKNRNIDAEIMNRVCYLIGNHHSYNKINGLDFQILVEADFLVNIYEDDMDKASITSIRNKYFKTKAGIRIIESLYL